MTLDFFLKNYDFNDMNITKLFIKDNKLYVYASLDVYLELIANGYRPEMNVEYDKIFIFDVNYKNHNFKNNKIDIINFNNGILNVIIDDIKLELFGNIEVKQ